MGVEIEAMFERLRTLGWSWMTAILYCGGMIQREENQQYREYIN